MLALTKEANSLALMMRNFSNYLYKDTHLDILNNVKIKLQNISWDNYTSNESKEKFIQTICVCSISDLFNLYDIMNTIILEEYNLILKEYKNSYDSINTYKIALNYIEEATIYKMNNQIIQEENKLNQKLEKLKKIIPSNSKIYLSEYNLLEAISNEKIIPLKNNILHFKNYVIAYQKSKHTILQEKINHKNSNQSNEEYISNIMNLNDISTYYKKLVQLSSIKTDNQHLEFIKAIDIARSKADDDYEVDYDYYSDLKHNNEKTITLLNEEISILDAKISLSKNF